MMQYPEIIALAYCGNGPEKLAKAERLYKQYGKKLLANEHTRQSLSALKKAVTALDSQMTAIEMGNGYKLFGLCSCC